MSLSFRKETRCKARYFPIFHFVILLCLLTCGICHAAEEDDLIADIEKVISLGIQAPPELTKSVYTRIEENSSTVTEALLPRINTPETSDEQLVTYTWALGIAGDPKSVDALIDLFNRTKSGLVRASILRALATIGGKKSGDLLLETFDKTVDEDMRFNILNLLGQMQYEPALPKTEEILRKDPKEYYWQPIFIYGKMGDKAIPFLLERIASEDRNVRYHAIHIVGHWLIPPDAVEPLQERYWEEEDSELRQMILASLERVTVELDMMKRFCEEVVAREKDEKLTQFAEETLEILESLKSNIDSYRREKSLSPEDFKREYDRLYKSFGKEGDYEILIRTSSYSDEPALKKLRERILRRDSDESFYDYQDVNQIIRFNRYLNGD